MWLPILQCGWNEPYFFWALLWMGVLLQCVVVFDCSVLHCLQCIAVFRHVFTVCYSVSKLQTRARRGLVCEWALDRQGFFLNKCVQVFYGVMQSQLPVYWFLRFWVEVRNWHIIWEWCNLKTSSVGQSVRLLIPRSSVRFRQKLKKSRTQIFMDLGYIDPQARIPNYGYK